MKDKKLKKAMDLEKHYETLKTIGGNKEWKIILYGDIRTIEIHCQKIYPKVVYCRHYQSNLAMMISSIYSSSIRTNCLRIPSTSNPNFLYKE